MTDIHTCRAKRIDNGEWIYGYVYYQEPPLQCLVTDNYIPEEPKCYILQAGFADWNMVRPVSFIRVDPKTVGRFTGIQDYSGKDVYEGDRVAFAIFDFNDSDTHYIGIVKLVWGQWSLVNSISPINVEGEEDGYNLFWVFNQYEEPKILGNIYDKEDQE